MTRPILPIGIAGAGLMGRWHADAARHAGARVLGIADPDLERAKRLAGAHGARAFGDAAAMLEALELRALQVCSPLATHAPLAELALSHGLDVLVEKPLGRDLPETERLVSQAGRARVRLAPVHQFPFQRGFTRACAGLARAGVLRHAEMTVCTAGGTGRKERALTELVAEILPHPLSVAQVLLRERFAQATWRIERFGSGEALVRASDGAFSFRTLVSCACRPPENSLVLRGDLGTWHVDFFHGYSYFEPGRTSRSAKILRPFGRSARLFLAASANLSRRALERESAYPGLRALVAAFYRAVREGGPAPIEPRAVLELAGVRDRLLAELA